MAGNAPSRVFETDYYLTNWASSIAEGVLEGVCEGLVSAVGIASSVRSAGLVSFTVGDDRLVTDGQPRTAFCMIIARPLASVERATQAAFFVENLHLGSPDPLIIPRHCIKGGRLPTPTDQ